MYWGKYGEPKCLQESCLMSSSWLTSGAPVSLTAFKRRPWNKEKERRMNLSRYDLTLGINAWLQPAAVSQSAIM